MMEISESSLFHSVKEIIKQSHEKVFRIANSTLLLTTGSSENLLLKMNNLFASKYLLYLPKEEELKQIINQDRIRFELDQENKNLN